MIPIFLPILLGAGLFGLGAGKKVGKAVSQKIKEAHIEVKDASVSAGEDGEGEGDWRSPVYPWQHDETSEWKPPLEEGNFRGFWDHVPRLFEFGAVKIRLGPGEQEGSQKARVSVRGLCGWQAFEGSCHPLRSGVGDDDSLLTSDEADFEAEQDSFDPGMDGGDYGDPGEDPGYGDPGEDPGYGDGMPGGGGDGGDIPTPKDIRQQGRADAAQQAVDAKLTRQAMRQDLRLLKEEARQAAARRRAEEKLARQAEKARRQEERRHRHHHHKHGKGGYAKHRRTAGIAIGRALERAYDACSKGAPDMYVGALPILGSLAAARRLFLLAKSGDEDSQKQFDAMKASGSPADRKAAKTIEQLLGGGKG